MILMKNKLPEIGKDQLKLLEKLCNASGVSGDEGDVRKIILKEISEFAGETYTDTMGNILVRQKNSKDGKLKVLIDAHTDEVGFMIVSDDGDGLYSFETVGGIDSRSLPGKQVLVGSHHVTGIIGAKPIHLTTADERANKLSVESLKIDVGSGKGKVNVGDRVVFATRFRHDDTNIFSKAIDDRIGVATLIELMKYEFKNIDLYFSFTVQEEIGLRGAKVAATAIQPDIAIAIDATPSNDHPVHDGTENTFYNTRLGDGPAIYTYDGGTLNDPRLAKYFSKIGKENGLQFQLRQPGGGGTNAGAIHKTKAGVPILSISVPHRYTHTAMSLSKISDWDATIKLLFLALQNLTDSILSEPRP
jgi:putative aminopeptidase FrvX